MGKNTFILLIALFAILVMSSSFVLAQVDAECNSNEACSSNELCQYNGVGSVCVANTCSTNDDCADLGFEFCFDGSCGEVQCLSQSDCTIGEMCSQENTCIKNTCQDDGECPSGLSSCDVDSGECVEKECVNPDGTKNPDTCADDELCLAKGDTYVCKTAACTSDKSCSAGFSCEDINNGKGSCKAISCDKWQDCSTDGSLVCGADNSCVENTCSQDNDCKDVNGESLVGLSVCTSNKCAPKSCKDSPNACGAGEVCNSQDLCVANTCQVDIDCTLPGLSTCDTNENKCIAKSCADNPSVCDTTEICKSQNSLPSLCEANTCAIDNDCKGVLGSTKCDGTTHKCVPETCDSSKANDIVIVGDTSCVSGEMCSNNKCVLNTCTGNVDCVVPGMSACVKETGASEGVCKAATCSGDVPCGTDETCAAGECRLNICTDSTKEVVCSEGEGCKPGSKLTPPKSFSQCVSGYCDSTNLCPEGKSCLNNECVVGKCSGDIDCSVAGKGTCKIKANDIAGLCVPTQCTKDSACSAIPGQKCDVVNSKCVAGVTKALGNYNDDNIVDDKDVTSMLTDISNFISYIKGLFGLGSSTSQDTAKGIHKYLFDLDKAWEKPQGTGGSQ